MDAERLGSLNSLLPSIKAEASTGAHQYNLATFGFNSGLLKQIAPLFPDVNFANFSTIVKVDVTTADAALGAEAWTVPIQRQQASTAVLDTCSQPA